MRMLSTDTSMRFFILESILALGSPASPYLNAPAPLWVTLRPYVPFGRGEGKAWAAHPDRRPQPHLPGVLRPPANEHLRRPGDQRRLRFHLHAGHRPGLPAGIRHRRLRPRQADVSLPGVRGVQGRPPGDAG